MVMQKQGSRAVIVGGVRTPFVKAFAEFMKLDTIALGVSAVSALIKKFELPRKEIDSISWGGVILPPLAPNVGREIALDLKLPAHVEAMTCTRACATGLQAVTLAAAAIDRGEADIVIAGGGDSTSNAALALPPKVVHALAPVAFGKATPGDMLGAVRKLMPIGDSLPRMPKIAERTTGEVMGEAAEKMARRNEISRSAQDAYAAASHHKAAASIESGRLREEVTPVEVPGGKWVHGDTMVRADTSEEKLAKLRPVFAKDGTLTAGNSTPLTDGAAAVLVMSEEKARALGYEPLARITSWSYVGVDPGDQLLMGPALAMPKALERAGYELADMDMIEMHEAFAAQVLSVIKMLESDNFARDRLGRDKAVGRVDHGKLNIHGSSLALGHPFAATGARMVTTAANELHQGDKRTAVLGICAAGGLGAGAVMERV